jgi:hypothetical protein
MHIPKGLERRSGMISTPTERSDASLSIVQKALGVVKENLAEWWYRVTCGFP